MSRLSHIIGVVTVRADKVGQITFGRRSSVRAVIASEQTQSVGSAAL